MTEEPLPAYADDDMGAFVRQLFPAGAEPSPPIFDPGEPLTIARAFVDREFMHAGWVTLRHHRGLFYGWRGDRYQPLSTDTLRAGLYTFLEGARRPVGRSQTAPFAPNAHRVGNVLDALKAVTHLPADIDPPCWLDAVDGPDPRIIIPLANGLYDPFEDDLIEHSPGFFNLTALPVPFDPDAPDPRHWHAFLKQVWPDDQASIDCLQEWFGLWLTEDTRHQKILMAVGPKRSGKGTIARVATALLGTDAVAAPTLGGLASNFGLAPLIGRRLAIVSDARISGRADIATIAERLLSISGEDQMSIDRKFEVPWTGKLPTRFLVLTNELPKLADASGALASRFIVLLMDQSFYGREDPGLTERLLGELPGILMWSIAGLAMLRRRRHFLQPPSAAEAIEEMEDLGSPVGAFLRDRCRVGPAFSVPCADLFDAWKSWCEIQGREHPGTLQNFGRDLRAATPGLKVVQVRDWQNGGKRTRFYQGVASL